MDPVTEGVSLVAAVVSAGAAVIGTFVTVSQWKASRPSGPIPLSAKVNSRTSSEPQTSSITTTQVPAGAVPRSRSRLRRWAISIAILGTIVCAAFSLGEFFFYIRHIGNDSPGLVTLLIVSGFTAILVVIAALPVLVVALSRRRFAEARAATIGLLLALLPWGLTFLFEAAGMGSN
jgi:hypothetical protein